jgi:transglutaminase-like putative cysteine protease
MRYEVVHTTVYEYSATVSISHHLARLMPRATPRQLCLEHELQVDPAPGTTSTHDDYFGNPTTFFVMQSAHQRLSVRARSVVDVTPCVPPAEPTPWETATRIADLPLEAVECLVDPASNPLRGELREYARPSFAPGRPLLDAVADLTARIHADFTYAPGTTTVATPLTQLLETRRGVCQDFARFEIGCLRGMGVATRYVSGYLETVPPPDAPHLIGSDASHAWVSVYVPRIGWVDVDPTNNLFPSDTHVSLAWGCDFQDVSPLRGVILGGGHHALKVSVDVNRVVG